MVIHLDPIGGLADRTYFSVPDPGLPIGLAWPADRSVSLAMAPNAGGPGVPVLAQLNFGDSQTPPAACLATDVLNAASLTFITGVVPGSVVTLTGFGIGPQEGVVSQPGADGAAPSKLGGVQVFFDGLPAPLLYVQSQQINTFAPFTLAGEATTNVSVVYNGTPIGSTAAPIYGGVTGFFRLNASSTQAAAINADGTLNGPSNPAPAGSAISLYGTGFGQTQLPGVAGTLFPATPSLLATPVQIAVDGVLAEVLYAGAAPSEYGGVDQINVRIPVGTGAGARAVTVASGLSSSVTTISVK